jgi:hypothetical protein
MATTATLVDLERSQLDELKLVDGHQHFWNPMELNYDWLQQTEIHPIAGPLISIKRPYLPQEFIQESKSQGVVMSVHLQAGKEDFFSSPSPSSPSSPPPSPPPSSSFSSSSSSCFFLPLLLFFSSSFTYDSLQNVLMED